MTDAGVYEFSNGVRLFRREMRDFQIARYREQGNPNLHEPIEEEWFVRLLKEADVDPVFADVGSALGYYTILARKLRTDVFVHSVEPLSVHREALERNLALNGISRSSVEVHTSPVAASSGPVLFFEQDFGSCIIDASEPRASSCLSLVGVSMADFLALIARRVELVKMDIQGSEAAVISAFLASCNPQLVSA